MEKIVIESNDAGQRLDRFLNKKFPALPSSRMQRAIREKKIKINRKRAQPSDRLQAGDTIELFLAPDLLLKKNRIPPKTPDLKIVYEDEHMLVAFKPAGLLSQKESVNDTDTLQDRLLYNLFKRGLYDPEGSFTPAICHRLDRNTAGLVLCAKDAQTQRLANEDIAEHRLHKYYLARVMGRPQTGKISVYLKKDQNRALISDEPREGYVPANLIIESLQTDPEGKDICTAEIELLTGRFHQIRATLAHLGHILEGDHKYGYQGPCKTQQLCAWKLDLSDCTFDRGVDVVSLDSEAIFPIRVED